MRDTFRMSGLVAAGLLLVAATGVRAEGDAAPVAVSGSVTGGG